MRYVLAMIAGMVACPGIAQPCQSVEEYDAIVGLVTERFFDQTFNGLDWYARVAANRSEIECADEAEDVAEVVNVLLSELNASHTALYTRSDMHYWGLNSFFSSDASEAYNIDFSGIWPERRNGAWYAKHVLEGSAAETAGVLAGD